MGTADRIKQARLRKKLTEEKIAQKLEIEPELYLRWEAGDCEPDTEHLLSLAKLLGTSANYLLYGSDGRGVETMFPKDAAPAATPLSDWRFLIGALLMFAGGAGLLFFVMRNIMNSADLSAVFASAKWSVIALAAVFAAGLIICIAVCISKALEGRRRNNKR